MRAKTKAAGVAVREGGVGQFFSTNKPVILSGATVPWGTVAQSKDPVDLRAIPHPRLFRYLHNLCEWIDPQWKSLGDCTGSFDCAPSSPPLRMTNLVGRSRNSISAPGWLTPHSRMFGSYA